MAERWSIYIDIEGFSALWEREDQVIWSLGELMRSIFRVGRLCFPSSPERLFAHQFGDGFVIVSDFHEESLERCTLIAIALMRHVAATGRFASAAIAEGEFSDIRDLYPIEVLRELEGEHTVSLRMGLMTIVPVMGTALIRGARISKLAPKGPLLAIEQRKVDRLGDAISTTPIADSELSSIDWVHAESPGLRVLQTTAELSAPSPRELERSLYAYCQEQSVPEQWSSSVRELLAVPWPDGA